MRQYKPDQGRLVRMATFWGLVLLLLFGCRFLHLVLTSYWTTLRQPIGGFVVPIVGVALSPSVIASSAIFLAGTWMLHRWLQGPRVADLLIDTESELRKVTWPSLQDVVNSSLVVVVSVLILMGFLAGVDLFLSGLVKRLLLGPGA